MRMPQNGTRHASDLGKDVFKQRSAKKIADSLKQSAEQSHRRKASSLLAGRHGFHL
ncbi:DUF3175 domain-containing protein (plasmid) [Rhizobium sp. CCGE531]|nr:DUF3175 domain-containing protein [Rhizobium sp. CCGE531]AYG76259.1 DUF3175 domain-containing protein [Rhizobium sp. CCGE532]